MEQRPRNRQPEHQPKPEVIIWEFLANRPAREGLIQGNPIVLSRARTIMERLPKEHSAASAKTLGEIAKHPNSSNELKAGALILFNAIPEEKRNKPVLSPKQRQQKLSELIKENPDATAEQLAEELQCSIRTVKKDKQSLRSAGEHVPSKPGRPKNPEIAERRQHIQTILITNPTISNQEIADELGCKKSDVENDIDKMKSKGIDLPIRVPANRKKRTKKTKN